VFDIVIDWTLKLNSASRGGVVGVIARLDWLDKLLELNRFLQRVPIGLYDASPS
jgi:hypothetical protein